MRGGGAGGSGPSRGGAFTGATSDREGLLEQADADTVFFDEMADIDRDTQRLLMAAIEGRGFQRLGDAKVRPSSFRLVCATNRSLADLRGELLDAGFFDLIAVFVLPVPPLRHCQDERLALDGHLRVHLEAWGRAWPDGARESPGQRVPGCASAWLGTEDLGASPCVGSRRSSGRIAAF